MRGVEQPDSTTKSLTTLRNAHRKPRRQSSARRTSRHSFDVLDVVQSLRRLFCGPWTPIVKIRTLFQLLLSRSRMLNELSTALHGARLHGKPRTAEARTHQGNGSHLDAAREIYSLAEPLTVGDRARFGSIPNDSAIGIFFA